MSLNKPNLFTWCAFACLSAQLSKCFQYLPSYARAVKTSPALGMLKPWHIPTHTHAKMHLNQPIRSSRGSLITKTGQLPCPNDGVFFLTPTQETYRPMETHTTQTHTLPPNSLQVHWSKRMMLGLTIYQRRMVGKEEFGQRVAHCSSASAQTSSSRQQPPLFTSG